jgi:hypothetical protein
VVIVPVVAGTGDKWNPHSFEGQVQKALFGSAPEIDYAASTQPSPEVVCAVAGFVPGLNSALVFANAKSTTFDKALAVGTDVLSVVGVGTVLKLGAKGVVLGKGLILGAKVAEGVVVGEDVVTHLGGSYGAVRRMASELGLGGQVHHMPAWAATRDAGVAGFSRWSAPSIWMETADHYTTLSHGRFGDIGKEYRVGQEALINSGGYLDALKMDVDHIRSLHGSKYDIAIQQMGEYIWKAQQ